VIYMNERRTSGNVPEKPLVEVVNLRKKTYHEYIGRHKGQHMLSNSVQIGDRGWLGNPFTLREHSRSASIQKFKEAFLEKVQNDSRFRTAVLNIRGRLGCYCKPRECHGDVIAEYINKEIR